MILYDHPVSANCLKVRILLRQLGLEFERVTIDLFSGEGRRPEHLARNPDGRVPVLALDSGELIPESAAILLYLAEGTDFLPADRIERARVHQWLFFEQNQVEAGLAVARFMRLTGQVPKKPEAFADRLRQGRNALRSLDRGLVDDVRRGRALHRRRHRALRLRALRRRRGRGPARVPAHRRLAGSRRGDAGVRERPRADLAGRMADRSRAVEPR